MLDLGARAGSGANLGANGCRGLDGRMTAYAAMIKAGFRKRESRKPTSLQKIQRIWNKATEAERVEIKEWIIQEE